MTSINLSTNIVQAPLGSSNLTAISPLDFEYGSIPRYQEFESKDHFIKNILIQYFTETKCLNYCNEKIVVKFEIITMVCPLLSKGVCLAAPTKRDKRIVAINKYKELYGEDELFEVLL